MIDGLVAAGIARRELSLAWAFRTQSSFSQLQALQAVPATLETAGALSTDVTGAADPALTAAVAGIYGASNQIGTVFSGTLQIAQPADRAERDARIPRPRRSRPSPSS